MIALKISPINAKRCIQWKHTQSIAISELTTGLSSKGFSVIVKNQFLYMEKMIKFLFQKPYYCCNDCDFLSPLKIQFNILNTKILLLMSL